MPRSGDLVMDLWEEWGTSLTRGLAAPWKNHSSRRLRDGSSGGDHSKPRSSTALDRMRKRSLGCEDCKGAGSSYEPDSSSASVAANDRLSSISPSSLPPNETRSFAVAEGCWSRWAKRTGENSLWGESEAHGSTAGVNPLISERKFFAPLLFPLRSLGGKKREGARGGVVL